MLFITGNTNKFLEAQQLIPELTQYALDLEEIQSRDIERIVEHKLQAAFTVVKQPCMVEDTALELEALNGMPGPFVKYFAKALGQEGIARIADGSAARAVCCVGYYDGTTTHFFVGEMRGTITTPRGEGFGFDVIFIPEGETKRVSELGKEYKSKHSHRARALNTLCEHLNT